MAFNQAGGASVSCTVLGGLVTEMVPPDLPEGVSPACQDVVFVPGSVASRPCLRKAFATAFAAGGGLGYVPTVPYGKSYVTPSGRILNLYLDSNGVLYYEDVAAPGVYFTLTNTTAACWAKSITAFGREYLAISDGLHGGDVPLQIDGSTSPPTIDRVTQDGPGSPPAVTTIALPKVGLAVIAGSGPTLDPTLGIYTSDLVNGYYTTLTLIFTAPVSLPLGTPVTVSGCSNAVFNGYLSGVTQIIDSVTVKLGGFYFASYQAGHNGTVSGTAAMTMGRAANIVTVGCAAAHHQQVGYQAQIASVPASPVGGATSSLTSIVINNQSLPGVATVTMSLGTGIPSHGLTPGVRVSISGVMAAIVGTLITFIARAGGVVTVTTSADHGLSPGAVVSINGCATANFNTTAMVLNVISSTQFTFAQVDATDAVVSGGTATVSINWPIPDLPTPTYFEVVAAPSPTTFQIALNYSDGTWATGTVLFAWNGTFFVSAVLSATVFQHLQYGPDDHTASTAGTVTPFGQAAPGQHQCQVLYLTRQGYITRPSPPISFIANGGEYISVSNIPIGPSNVVARILAFTGANGACFYYISDPAQINGQQVSTATQINDNTTTAVTLDFSDNTLFASLAISIPGNNLAAQIVLDGALGFGFYGSRLITWGQRNRIQNFLNMGFDGGALPTSPTFPTGWHLASGSGAVALAAGHFGIGLAMDGVVPSVVTQSAFRDCYGAPIAQPNTLYKLRVWLKASGMVAGTVFTANLIGTGFTNYATIAVSGLSLAGAWAEATFSAKTPAEIPADLILSISCSGSVAPCTVLVDEVSIIYADAPYLDSILYGSYADNPEAFDGVAGKFGASQDSHKVMDLGEIRRTLYILTQEPGGRIHQTQDSGISEPAGWQVDQVAANCGLLSAFSLTKSQADDTSASGGEEWFAWASASGARIFEGGTPWKISQEIQPDWDRINPAYNSFAWALNDPVKKVMYFGLPLTAATQGTANKVYQLCYRQLETASEIDKNGPIRTSYTGRLIATDHTRKWTVWNMTVNGAALMFRSPGALVPVFFGGNGTTLGMLTGFGNVYTLDAAKFTDDDYGRVYPFYTTYFFVTHDQEEQLKLGAGRKLLAYLRAFVSGLGSMTITAYCDTLTNPWPADGVRTLAADPKFYLEWTGGNAQGDCIALKFASSPLTGTDNWFNLKKITATIRVDAHKPVRGSAT